MREKPGPEVAVRALAPAQTAPMTAEMLAAESQWLPQFEGRELRPTPTISIPSNLERVDVPLDPALAIANRFQILAEQKT